MQPEMRALSLVGVFRQPRWTALTLNTFYKPMTKSRRRPAIPKKLQLKLLYESAYACAVCQRGGVQIHHIDADNANNSEANLVVICHVHHDEAHTRRSMSKNLDATALRDAKTRWTSHVREYRSKVATISGQRTMIDSAFVLTGITWGYINHRRVIAMVDPRTLDDDANARYRDCLQRGLVDERGIIDAPPLSSESTSPMDSTIYDRFRFGDDQRFHAMYSALVDRIAGSPKVVHIERESFTKARLSALLKSGSIIFMQRAFYFREVSVTQHNEHRRALSFRNGVEVEFFVDTRDMFGTTSMTTSFVGHQTTAALLQLKSIGPGDSGRWRLSCTPIAMGIGFQPLPGPAEIANAPRRRA
jgi:hypothetical protein